ncbi:hypothetical protein [Frigoribacterium sp. PvP032]|uniref:hypothetical protein n=1 Tax=Frigoribacterium sp. PvP032 TaxID=2806589 RepID=UPI001AE113C1|nr:hypothetical protein [Frigoribacterium sp. PvP032]MBP1190875.1 hypothetical protein [Frigoribacterium sp. PvP032]
MTVALASLPSVPLPDSASSAGSAVAPDPHRPVVSDDDLAARVTSLVPVAVRRQLWTLFFDADDVQLPILVPLEGVPEHPDRLAMERWGDALEAVSTEFGVTAVVFVLERPGPSSATTSDHAWHRVLTGLSDARRFAVRAVFTCASDGVVVLQRDDRAAGGDSEGHGGARAQSSPRRLRLSDELAVR